MGTKFERAALAFKIDGYRTNLSNLDETKEFAKAKNELIEAFQGDIETIKEMGLDEFNDWREVDFNTDKVKSKWRLL
tara:strand:+ start:1545 stop:1775 length:231 start_codon:yes stop_codon:yes gene_type:complete